LEFGLLVIAGQLVVGKHFRFDGGYDLAGNFFGQTNAADGAGINNFGTARAAGRGNDVARAFDVDLIHGRVITHPQAIVGGGVKTPVAAGQFALEERAVKDVAGDALEFMAEQRTFLRARSQQGLDAVTARQ